MYWCWTKKIVLRITIILICYFSVIVRSGTIRDYLYSGHGNGTPLWLILNLFRLYIRTVFSTREFLFFFFCSIQSNYDVFALSSAKLCFLLEIVQQSGLNGTYGINFEFLSTLPHTPWRRIIVLTETFVIDDFRERETVAATGHVIGHDYRIIGVQV